MSANEGWVWGDADLDAFLFGEDDFLGDDIIDGDVKIVDQQVYANKGQRWG